MIRVCSSTLVATLSLFLLLVPATTWAQTHFTDCVANDANDATVLISDSVTVDIGDADSLQTGDEIALFSNDGRCAGVGVWDASSGALSIAVAGVDSTAQLTNTYEVGEPLQFRIWRQSDETVYKTSDVAYDCTLTGCRSDGLYDAEALYEVAELNASSLPVELTTFEATKRQRAIVLTWRTASETKNAGFEIQHKASGDDAWSSLSFVDGAGTTTSPQTYRYEVEDLGYGKYEFRIKQVDQDGSTSLSTPVQVSLSLEGAYELSELAPNPVRTRGALELTVQKEQHVTVQVYDVLGRRTGTPVDRTMNANQTQTLRLEADGLSTGKYFIRVQGEHFRAHREMTVVK